MKNESTKRIVTLESKLHKRKHFRSEIYYYLWNAKENRFNNPVPYHFTFPITFPNLILKARYLEDARAKIEIIIRNVKGKDRFEYNEKRLQWACSKMEIMH
ncbi:MAG: hypothetical protein QG670_2725 [Thermoproteota archaeon]|nr:hypothetical protein [Thermoproteota archaeon]